MAAENIDTISWREIGAMPTNYFVSEQDLEDVNDNESSSYLLPQSIVNLFYGEVIPSMTKQYPEAKGSI